MTDVSKTGEDWTEEQARKIGEATEESVRESGADVGATARAESTKMHKDESVEEVGEIPFAKKSPPDARQRRKPGPATKR